MSYARIARMIGFSETSVRRYGREILPACLRLRHGHSSMLAMPRCARCSFLGDERNPVDEASGLCLWCRVELTGMSLLEFHESGLAVGVGMEAGG